MIQQFGLVAVGGAIGAVMRYGIGYTITANHFPWPTLLVNVVGSFMLGMLSVMAINNIVSKDAVLFSWSRTTRCFYHNVNILAGNR